MWAGYHAEGSPRSVLPTQMADTLTSPAAPPTAPPVAVRHNVPAALSSLVGRAREVAQVEQALGAARLVTLVGPGGAGKTRLAREVAARAVHAARYPGGVWWVELAPIAAESDVAAAVASVLAVTPTAGARLADALAGALRGPDRGASPPVLLVLDNCEHVVDAAAALADALLRGAPGLTVLATGRGALGVEGEVAWPVPPLGRPPVVGASGAGAGGAHDLPLGADAVGAYEAVQLFVERAQGTTPGFALTNANAPAVAAVCARLDGLPLALELAAAALPALGVEQLAARLDDVFALLTRGRRTALPKHRTLRALLDWSYTLLGDVERVLLRRLAVFRSPFTLDTAEAVCGDAGPGNVPPDARPDARPDALPRGAVAGALGRLVEQSLVDVREQDGETRYRLLETVRQYGLARLAEVVGAERAARARHAAWVDALTAAAEPYMWSAARGRTVRRLERDVAEVRAALGWAAGPDGEPMTAVRIAGALAWFWFSGVPWAEARAHTTTAFAAADAQGVPDEARPPGDQAALAILGYPHAGMAYFAGDPDTTLRHAARTLALWDLVDAARRADPAFDAAVRRSAVRGRSVVEQLVGFAHAMRGEPGPALAAMDACVATARDGGEAWTEAVMTSRRAFARALLGRTDEALADYTAALALLRAVGETWFLSFALDGMAAVEAARGDVAAAAAHARESVTELGDEADAWFVSRSLDTLAQVAVTPGPGGAAVAARATTAARLAGAAAALRSRCGAEIVSHNRARHTATLAAARAAAGDAAFDRAWAEGEALDLGGAIALAVQADVADLPGAPPRSSGPAVVVSPAPAGPVVPAPVDAPALRVEVLGPPAVARRGAPLAAGELPAGKATELLLLLVARPKGVTREQAGVALWPDASAAEVRNAFHVLLHHVRRALAGADRDADAPVAWVVFADGHYRLVREAAPGLALDCDLDAVLAAADRLRRAERQREALSPGALDDLADALDRAQRGAFGQGTGAGDWASEVEVMVRAAWTEGTQLVARQHARAGRYAAGAAALAALVAREPLREEAHRELMVLLTASGEQARALAHYDALAALLRREVGAEPARETRALADRIRCRP